jgi:hypothetical protein
MATGSEVLLTRPQHSDLSNIAQSRSLPAGYVFRAKLLIKIVRVHVLSSQKNECFQLRFG